MKVQNLRHTVFWPPFLLLLVSTILGLTHKEEFIATVKAANQWILQHFDWLFSWSTFACLALVAVIYFSPLAKVKIGGVDAVPLLSKWRWFSITLCTTIATGIIFWGCAEPLYHYHSPPALLGIEAASPAAQHFAMSTMYMHWTLTPYSIYTVMGLLFAICYYNLRQPFSLGTLLWPVLGRRALGHLGRLIDVVCLFALVAGMAASLGGGILTISGGLHKLLGLAPSQTQFGLITLTVVAAFIISAGSGLLKGIRVLSDYNTRAFLGLAVFLFLFGPTLELLKIGGQGLIDYITNFLPRSTNLIAPIDDEWRRSWTVFYWANWLAWAPISALFLGRISRGYTVKQFIHINLLITPLFSGIWMMIFSGSTLHFDQSSSGLLWETLNENGAESVIYNILALLPAAKVMSMIFLLVAFLSFVTAADSNTSAMSAICAKGISPENAEAPFFIKILWGVLIGLVAWIMISYTGIDGLKTLSTIGGFPALFLLLFVLSGLVLFLLNREKFKL